MVEKHGPYPIWKWTAKHPYVFHFSMCTLTFGPPKLTPTRFYGVHHQGVKGADAPLEGWAGQGQIIAKLFHSLPDARNARLAFNGKGRSGVTSQLLCHAQKRSKWVKMGQVADLQMIWKLGLLPWPLPPLHLLCERKLHNKIKPPYVSLSSSWHKGRFKHVCLHFQNNLNCLQVYQEKYIEYR